MHLISLGAGVQSSTMALMAAHGKLTPMPDGAIFADTGDEPGSVYRWLDWLEPRLPFPVHRVQYGVLSVDSFKVRKRRKDGSEYVKSLVPLFIKAPDGKVGVAIRKCTWDYKVACIRRKAKELAGRGRRVGQWIGITTDEAHRMKDSGVAYLDNAYPLIDRRMTRGDCLRWMERHGYPRPPRSACVFCPFHHPKEWYRLQTEEPAEFEKAVWFEHRTQEMRHLDGMYGTPYLTRQCVPLESQDFAAMAQVDQLDLFGNECEGMCGV